MRPDLPIEPIRRLIKQDLQRLEWHREDRDASPRTRWPGLGLLADQVKIDQRRLRAILNEQDRVTVDVADQYCLATGRHLADVYPELYEPQPDAWVDECRHCGGVYFDVAAEGAHRMLVRCRECGRRKAVEDRPGKRTRPRPDCWALAPGDVHDAVQLYRSGLPIEAVAQRLGVSYSTAQRYLVLAGVERRSRRMAPEAQRRGRITASARAWPVRRIVVWLRAKGLTYPSIGRRLGISASSAGSAMYRARQVQVSVRFCANPCCSEHGQPYPVPPVEVLARQPELDRCPACNLRGQGEGDWWQLTA